MTGLDDVMAMNARHRRVCPWGAALALGTVVVGGVCIRHGMQWGSTAAERARPLPGDTYLEGGPPAHVAMTRAVSIDAPPEVVWPWIAQLGRGAGWYSFDRLDNGGRASASHLVSWIPPPRIGDATAVGYLRRLEEGRAMTWWVPGERVAGAATRMVFDFHLSPSGAGSRLVIRISGDASGLSARPLLWGFAAIDSIMARRQLLGIKERAETHGSRTVDPDQPETGERDQYQLYEVIYASGDLAGVPGKENASRWRKAWLDLRPRRLRPDGTGGCASVP